jgi:hypothetical protein
VLGEDFAGTSQLRSLTAHPKVAATPDELLTEHRADDEADELQTNLLRIKAELWREDLGYLHGVEDGGEVEDDRVKDGGDNSTWAREKVRWG